MKNKSNEPTLITQKGVMTEAEFNHAIKLIKCKPVTMGACHAILVDGYSSKRVCSAFSITRPTINKYVNLIKDEWRKNYATK